MKYYYVYILSSNSGTLYIGVTSNLISRVYSHKNNFIEGFTKKYQCHRLVYFEETNDVYSALMREKQLKRWRREKKERLIKSTNPTWRDFSKDIGLSDSSTYPPVGGFARNDSKKNKKF